MWKATIGKQISTTKSIVNDNSVDDDWDTDPDFVNNVSEKEQRWGSKTVEGSGHLGSINLNKLRDEVTKDHETIKKKEYEESAKPSTGYGGKFGVQQDRKDKSAVGFDHQESLEKHSSQIDYAKGFGGKYGVQQDRKDKSAVGFDHQESLQKHSSQTDYAKGFGGKYGVLSDRKDKSAVGFDHVEKVEKHSSQIDHSKGFGGKYGVLNDRKDKSAVGFEHQESLQKHSSQIDYSKGFGGKFGVEKTMDKSALKFEDENNESKPVGTNYQRTRAESKTDVKDIKSKFENANDAENKKRAEEIRNERINNEKAEKELEKQRFTNKPTTTNGSSTTSYNNGNTNNGNNTTNGNNNDGNRPTKIGKINISSAFLNDKTNNQNEINKPARPVPQKLNRTNLFSNQTTTTTTTTTTTATNKPTTQANKFNYTGTNSSSISSSSNTNNDNNSNNDSYKEELYSDIGANDTSAHSYSANPEPVNKPLPPIPPPAQQQQQQQQQQPIVSPPQTYNNNNNMYNRTNHYDDEHGEEENDWDDSSDVKIEPTIVAHQDYNSYGQDQVYESIGDDYSQQQQQQQQQQHYTNAGGNNEQHKNSAVALYSYDGEQEDELTFAEGAVITNIQMIDDGWWQGEYNNRCGLFPANYVQLMQ